MISTSSHDDDALYRYSLQGISKTPEGSKVAKPRVLTLASDIVKNHKLLTADRRLQEIAHTFNVGFVE